mgnify:CR=1 FL=1
MEIPGWSGKFYNLEYYFFWPRMSSNIGGLIVGLGLVVVVVFGGGVSVGLSRGLPRD